MSIETDIKLHPVGEEISYCIYKCYLDKKHFNKVNIIYGVSGEMIVYKYKIIIIDYLPSALTDHILALDIPVIIYDVNFSSLKIKAPFMTDLMNRCYIARNKEQLSKLVTKFAEGKLVSKLDDNFLDQYIVPSHDLEPCEKITKYIESII